MHADIALLPGDGIGPEVTAAAVTVLRALARRHGHTFDFHEYDIGGIAIDRHGEPLPASTLAACQTAPSRAPAMTPSSSAAATPACLPPCNWHARAATSWS